MFPSFYIFRHGLATYSTTGYGKHVHSADILPEAIPPITKMSEYLRSVPSDINVSSEFKRCRQTVQIVTDITGKQFVFDKRLNEHVTEGNPYYVTTFEDLQKRVEDFLSDMKNKRYRNVLVCTHGSVIAAIKYFVLYNRLSEENLFDIPKPGVLLIIKDKKIEEIDFNN